MSLTTNAGVGGTDPLFISYESCNCLLNNTTVIETQGDIMSW